MTNSTITLTTMPGSPWTNYTDDYTTVEATITLTELEKAVEMVTPMVEEQGDQFLKSPKSPVEFHARVIAYINELENSKIRNLMALVMSELDDKNIAKETLELIATGPISKINHRWATETIDELKVTLKSYDMVTA